MTAPLRLNDYDVRRNAAAGSHDPSMMWDPVTKKYYSYSTDVHGGMLGVEDYVGIPVRSSEDLVTFTYHGSALSDEAVKQGRNNGPHHQPTRNFWAPYVEYARGEYRMYYSATKAFGSSESRIWLAAADDPLGPFENRGVVADTWDTDNTFPNAIDPHLIWDGGRCWLVYGSFFGGIYIKELDPDTGLAADGNPKTLGTCISRKAPVPKLDGPEGAAVIYNPETGYFYLFQSYGWLGDGYDIRVGRSKCVTGPYVDRTGEDMVEKALGHKIAGSYRFTASNPPAGTAAEGWEWGGFRGPGHGVPFFDPNRNAYFFIHHVRDGAMVNATRDPFENRLSFIRHYMMVRPMFFIDGWPVLAPEPFAGDPLTAAVPKAGRWEMIFHDDNSNNQKESVILDLPADSPYLTGGYVLECWEIENQTRTLTVTGVDNHDVAYWGKYTKEDDHG